MVKRIRFGFIAVSLSALLIIILVKVHALWDVGDDFNFTLGYNDTSEEDKIEIRGKENTYLKIFPDRD